MALCVAAVLEVSCTTVSRGGLHVAEGRHGGPTSNVLTLNGEWSYHVGDTTNSEAPDRIPANLPRMHVPSNWFKEGLDHAGVVWFLREVDIEPKGITPVAVRFGAVDYAADVYWDGARIGGHRGYFSPFVAHVPEGRRGAGRHVLAVRVDSPREEAEAWSLHKTLIKGVLGHHDTRPGGAWSSRGQDANTGGIWGGVELVEAKNGFFDDVRVTTEELTSTRARLRIEARVGKLRAPAQVHFTIRDPHDMVVARGEAGQISRDGELTTQVVVRYPLAWWPYEDGTPNLHTLRLELDGAAGVSPARRHVLD